MSCKNMDRLMDNVRVNVPGAIDVDIKMELFNTLDSFLRKTHMWQEELEVEVTPGVTSYDLFPQTPSHPLKLLGVENSDEIPVHATMRIPGQLVLMSDPSNEDTLTATISLTIQDPTNKDDLPIVPSWIVERYRDGLTDGVIGRLMARIAKPYSNPNMAMFRMRRFFNAAAHARAENMQKNVYRGQAWRFPAFT